MLGPVPGRCGINSHSADRIAMARTARMVMVRLGCGVALALGCRHKKIPRLNQDYRRPCYLKTFPRRKVNRPQLLSQDLALDLIWIKEWRIGGS